jgi:3-(3-hydroxy-phenyl)propionate hydroxylase
MQAVGVVNELIPTLVLGYGSEYFSPAGRPFLKVKPTTLEYGYPRRNAFRQPVLEAILRKHLLQQERATNWFGTELIEFAQSAQHVTVRLRRDGVESEVTCDYLIGCDGSRSFVRQRLGIAMQGSTFKERWLIIDLDETGDRTRDTKVFCNPARPCLSLPGPNGTRRFEFMLHDGESEDEALAPENVASLLRLYGPDDAAPIRRKTVYTFHARMADRWRVGRVFLAGDAAHLMPPFAGQGMNSGVRDAHNLAWKLAAVASGTLGEILLDTYEAERRTHASEMIALAIRMGHVMMPRNRGRAFALQTFFRMLALYPAARSYFAEMKYKPKPSFHNGFLLNPPRNEPGTPERASERSLIGKLFPQALVATATGYQLLDDLLGDGFALLASPGAPTTLIEQAMRGSKAPFPIRFITVLDREDASRVDDGIVTARDLRGDLAKLLAGHRPGLFLLRPDRYVAAFFAADQMPALWTDVTRLSDSTWPDITDTREAA